MRSSVHARAGKAKFLRERGIRSCHLALCRVSDQKLAVGVLLASAKRGSVGADHAHVPAGTPDSPCHLPPCRSRMRR